MYKRALITFLSITLLACWVNGQFVKVKNDPTHDDKPIHFGFSLGLNFMDYQIEQSEFTRVNNYYVGVSDLTPGINIQAIANLRLTEYLDLRCLPGISFGERKIHFLNDTNYNLYGGNPYQAESSFLEMPLYIKYKSKREVNFRPYVLGGVNIRYDLSAKKEYDYDEQLFIIKPFNLYTEFGTGLDFYLANFKFAVEFKYSVGMFDIFNSTTPSGKLPPAEMETYTNMIDKIKSNIFVISFHFE